MKNQTKYLAFLFVLAINYSHAQNPLQSGFQTPPNAAQPRVWWHWMNGNITKDGIQKDLEWMKRTGIGGFQNFDANLFTPVVVPKKLVFMTPDWKDAFKFTTELADKMGLEMAIAGSPGWSVTGGTWVEPIDAMKKYVWTETRVKKGDNVLEIKVTNLWVNRLIGDAQPDVKTKTTFTTMPFYQANAPLLPSGLMGPVQILKISEN
jgi:hypothetical protein